MNIPYCPLGKILGAVWSQVTGTFGERALLAKTRLSGNRWQPAKAGATPKRWCTMNRAKRSKSQMIASRRRRDSRRTANQAESASGESQEVSTDGSSADAAMTDQIYRLFLVRDRSGSLPRNEVIVAAIRSVLNQKNPSDMAVNRLADQIRELEGESERGFRQALQKILDQAVPHRSADDPSSFSTYLSIVAS